MPMVHVISSGLPRAGSPDYTNKQLGLAGHATDPSQSFETGEQPPHAESRGGVAIGRREKAILWLPPLMSIDEQRHSMTDPRL